MASLPPATTPAAFKAYLNAHVNHGKPVAGGNVYPGASVGDQWLAFYADKHGKLGGKYTLLQYEEAFVAYITTALLNTDLQAGITGAAQTAAQAGAGAAQGGLTIYQNSIFQFLGRLSDPVLWLRAVKVIVGGALLIAGAAKITGADRQVAALGKAVAKAPFL